MMFKIEHATADYTGGNIYVYHGKWDIGQWFLADDDSEQIMIFDVDTSGEEIFDPDYQELHHVASLFGRTYRKTFKDILDYVIQRRPSGNYDINELEARRREVGLVCEECKYCFKIKTEKDLFKGYGCVYGSNINDNPVVIAIASGDEIACENFKPRRQG